MDRLRALLAQLRAFFMALPPGRRVSFVGLTLAVLVGTLGLAYWAQLPAYRVMFHQLSPSDAAAVVEYLKAEQIPFRVGEGGTTIEVDAARVHETRLALAGKGIPQGGGVGFEIFDKQTLGMTDFVQRLDFQRALQGELARTINELNAVEAARVHLALPERSLFVAEERRPSASVVLKLRPGRSLSQEQIGGVVHLVASSVEGLRPADVTVVDVTGQVLSRNLDDESGGHGKGVLAFQREVEQGFTEGIESMLERVLGPRHAIARVTVSLDMAQVEKTEESFDPDRVAVRNERRSRETNVTAAASGVPGVTATLTNEPSSKSEEGPRSEHEDSNLAYEISKVTSRRIESMGGIKKLSVAVVIDGTYQGEGSSRTFVPRPSEEIDRYRELIKRAVGFNEDRGDQIEIASAPFHSPAAEAPESPGMLARLGRWSDTFWRAAGLLAAVIIALTVVRPFLLTMASRVPVAPRATVTAGARVPALPEPRAETAQNMAQVARANPEQTARVIAQWVGSE